MTEAANPGAGIAQIGNLAQCQTALSLPGIVCFYGFSGYGKSLAANRVCNDQHGYYIQIKSIWSKKCVLQKILLEMGIKPGHTAGDMLDQICDQLSASGRPLVIDEMDHLVDKNAVELVRDIYEGSQAPILIIGEEQLPKNWKSGNAFMTGSCRLCSPCRSVSRMRSCWSPSMHPASPAPTTCWRTWSRKAKARCVGCASIWTKFAKRR